ncbi:MAG: hypothetical protein SF339_28620 [Blastocatellia bacterium]|nr:hypothetical protein [Blastocatellia bacterium]
MNRNKPNHAEAADRLAGELIEIYASQVDAEAELAAGQPFFAARVRNRIREMREQNVSSWEAAVMAMRGWILALCAAAILFFLVGAQVIQQTTPATLETDEINTSEELIGEVR